MSSGDRKYTRIPPESTGDRMQVRHSYAFNYNSKVSPIYLGDEISCISSNFTGEIIAIQELTGTTGIIWVNPDPSSEDIDVVSGENIQVDAVTVANVLGAGYPVYTNTTHVVGWNNAQNGQYVDSQGQAYVRFRDGALEFDAFGRARVSQLNNLASYIFDYNHLSNLFSAENIGSATVTHNATSGCVLLTNTTGATDESKYTSDLYHPYYPGFGQVIVMSVACGDTGKANLERSWGYFDDDNGIFFRQTVSGFEVVVRSNVSGSPVETIVTQDDFNVDKVDGSSGHDNLSKFELDTSKDVVYWITFQWLGAGTVSFGCYGNGQSITMHKISFSGMNSASYMRHGNLPLRFQQTNTGATGSTSEFRCFCAEVANEAQHLPHKKKWASQSFSQFTVTDSELYLFSFRSASTINGVQNKRITLPDDILYSVVKNGATDTDDRIIIRLFLNATLTTPNWTSITSSGLEYDDSATLGAHTILLGEWYVKGTGQIAHAIDQGIDSVARLLVKADGTQPTLTYTAQHPTSGNTALAYIKPIFNEVEP